MADTIEKTSAQEPEDRGKTLASWEFPEFIKHQRSFGWYIGVFIIIAALITFSLVTQNYLFAIVIVLFLVVYIIRARREPQMVAITLYEDGIGLGQKSFYLWKDIRAFWIIYEPPHVKNLYIDFKASYRPSITVYLENQNPLRIRKILLNYIPEDTERENESFSDGFSRMLKL
ncbi:MAG: hypothetical protein PHY34_02645 [Patescibacteria group bacterium]|nr:hypothetical protein [Patescibacteria group bacterium]MDD5715458.1 hypothetical protein [Patescibacteria group bacterium]